MSAYRNRTFRTAPHRTARHSHSVHSLSEQIWQGERVAIPREAVARVRKRELDRKKTAIAFVGAVAAVVAVQGISGSNSGAPPNYGPITPPGR